MKSEQVTQAWEFYRDNCPGFKEPMRKQFRKLDEYVSVVESENAKLRSELESVGTAAYLYGRGDLQAENARLRELVRQWYPHMLKRVGRDALEQWGQMDVVKELGIEADS